MIDEKLIFDDLVLIGFPLRESRAYCGFGGVN
jgi:hypothetical protein